MAGTAEDVAFQKKAPRQYSKRERDSWSMKYRFGIYLDDYEKIHDAQGGLCAICRRQSDHGIRLSVDHDHSTGMIRGLLCRECNSGLGFFRDSPELLVRAIAYLGIMGQKPGVEIKIRPA